MLTDQECARLDKLPAGAYELVLQRGSSAPTDHMEAMGVMVAAAHSAQTSAEAAPAQRAGKRKANEKQKTRGNKKGRK